MFFFMTYQVAEAPEERVGQHEFPSLFDLLGNGLVNVIGGQRTQRDKYKKASQPHLATACAPGNSLQAVNTRQAADCAR